MTDRLDLLDVSDREPVAKVPRERGFSSRGLAKG
jgi:hypothetical protein